ncbi:acetyltransferase [Flavonifractor sp. An91]|uniref:acetyltransferase n=1 Tax=Flavonifractor sp. An91 TaxID=1965665 RepID=UPI000B39C370|nr:acetyltransferase [Flavonifractor sp. An91]OUN06769.1 acetyltransferase [Flavonifractor sp. An91]
MKKLGIIGASGHGKVVADIAKKMGCYQEIVFFDDNADRVQCGDYPVAGKSQDIFHFECDGFVAIGNALVRQRLQEEMEKRGIHVPVLIHPAAVVAEDVQILPGTAIMAGAVINPGSVIGKGCIVNTCASVDHDNVLEDYVHVAVGAHIAGTVQIGHHTWVGAGATVSNNINICANCMIGAGTVVCKSIVEEGTYVGVPARKK